MDAGDIASCVENPIKREYIPLVTLGDQLCSAHGKKKITEMFSAQVPLRIGRKDENTQVLVCSNQVPRLSGKGSF